MNVRSESRNRFRLQDISGYPEIHAISSKYHQADRRDKNLQPVGSTKKPTNDTKLTERIVGNRTKVLKIGLDMHGPDVLVCVQEDSSLA